MAIPSLALIPSGFKDGKLYSVLPTSGAGDFTVVRGSNATRVNSSGMIETMTGNEPRLDYTDGGCPVLLTEPQSTNLFEYSEDLSQSSWGTFGPETTRTFNATVVNPTGNLGAYVIEGVSGLRRFGTILTVIPNTDYTFSFYVKNVDATLLKALFTNSSVYSYIYTSQVNTTDWTRVEINFTSSTTTSCIFQITRDLGVGESVYFWGVQLEQETPATSYISTSGAISTRLADIVSVDLTSFSLTSITETIDGVDQTPITSIPSTYTIPQGNINKITMI